MSRMVAAFADSALLLPAAILVLVYLVASRNGAAARMWLLVLGACAAFTLVSKLLFHACGAEWADLDVTSPSGHASLATVFYGALAILVTAGRPRWQQWLAGLGVAALVVLVGISRVRTSAHSPAEVLLGWLIGALCLAFFWFLHRRAGAPAVSPWPLAIGFVLLGALLGGLHFDVEHGVRRVARTLTAAFDVCQTAQMRGDRPHFGHWQDLVRRPPG